MGCQSLSPHLAHSPQDDLAPLIHPHGVKHALCHIDPEDAHLVHHWTRLLWLSGFTDRARIVAHRSRSAQGRVHCMTTLAQLDQDFPPALLPPRVLIGVNELYQLFPCPLQYFHSEFAGMIGHFRR